MGYRNKHQTPSTTGEIERIIPHTTPWYRRRLVREHELRYKFAQKYTQRKIVLDIACGSGFGTALIAQTAKKVYGIDSDHSAIEYAQTIYRAKNSTYSVGDAEKISLKDKSIDILISFETIEHLKHPKKFLREVKRLLKKDGMFILSTPNKTFSHGDNPYHYHEFTYTELVALLSEFHTVELYGQRPVNAVAFSIYRYLEKQFSFAHNIFRFRPWEKIRIEKMNKHTNYLYYIAICKK